MTVPCPLFEGLDLLDLWHLYGHIGRVAQARGISVSKVSRRTHEFLNNMGLGASSCRGVPDRNLLKQAQSLGLLRLAYQQWRLEQGWLKVLPTFSTVAVLRPLSDQLDELPDCNLSADAIADHLRERRLDLVLSSSLDLAGELIEEAQAQVGSLLTAIPLFEDPLMLALNPAHPLAGSTGAAAEDCALFPSPAYPEPMASRAAAALKARGLWRFACKRPHFELHEWLLGMRSTTGLCYVSALLLETVPQSRELALIPFAHPLQQTTAVVMLKEIAEHPTAERVVERIRQSAIDTLMKCNYEAQIVS